MLLKDYKNIIFDFGGVILNLDYQRTINEFKNLGLNDFEQRYTQLAQTDLFDMLERGEASPDEFRAGLREAFTNQVTDQELDTAWNAMLLDLPSARLDWLQSIRVGRNISLLSNTNEIHIACFESEMKLQHGFENLSGFFDTVYYSSRVGMRKPDVEIFEMVIEKEGYNPSETLFIDDSPQHIAGAKKAGLNAYHLRANEGETMCYDDCVYWARRNAF